MRGSRFNDGGSIQASQHVAIQRVKVIVDKDVQEDQNGNQGETIRQTVTDAINSVEEGFATIKVTSNLYEERIDITKPGIEIRPKERAGEVTFQQKTDPCFVIDIGEGNVCTLENLRMLLKGPNRDAERQSFMTDMNFEQQGNEECMREFFTHILKQTPTIYPDD